MGKFRDNRDDGGETGVDMSPLIDCVFILLIFFIVTTTFVEEQGVEVDKPQAAAPSQGESESVVLSLTERGDVVYEGRVIGLSGVQPLVKRMMTRDDVPVIIQADSKSQSGLLVRVIDEAKLAGAKTVSLASQR